MKKIKTTLAVIMTAAFILCGCASGTNKTESESRTQIEILTSYIDVEDSSYKGVDTTIFYFADRESAEDFMYFWLDNGQTVGGVIQHTNTGYYSVEIIESRFYEVCNAAVKGLGGA